MSNVLKFLCLLLVSLPAGCSSMLWRAHPYSEPRARGTARDRPEPDIADVSSAVSTGASQSAQRDGPTEPNLDSALENLPEVDPERRAALGETLRQADNLSPADRQFLEDQLVTLAGIARTHPGDTSRAAPPASSPNTRAEPPAAESSSPPRTSSVEAREAAVDSAVAKSIDTAQRLPLVQPASLISSDRAARDDTVANAVHATATISDHATELPPDEDAPSPATVAEPVAQARTNRPEVEQPAVTEPQAEPETPAVAEPSWHALLASTIGTLERTLADSGRDAENAARLEVYLRLLYVIQNQQQDAATPIDRLPEDERDFWVHQLYGLLVSLDADERHAPSRRSARTLRHLRTAVDHLANVGTLDVRNLAFCKGVFSYGSYDEFKPYTFRPGNEVVLYVEIENFAAEELGDEFETELQGEYAIFDEAGARVVSVVLPLDKQVCKNRRRDYFIAYRIYLPEKIAVGQYTLVLTMEDVKGDKSNQASIGFQIR